MAVATTRSRLSRPRPSFSLFSPSSSPHPSLNVPQRSRRCLTFLGNPPLDVSVLEFLMTLTSEDACTYSPAISDLQIFLLRHLLCRWNPNASVVHTVWHISVLGVSTTNTTIKDSELEDRIAMGARHLGGKRLPPERSKAGNGGPLVESKL